MGYGWVVSRYPAWRSAAFHDICPVVPVGDRRRELPRRRSLGLSASTELTGSRTLLARRDHRIGPLTDDHQRDNIRRAAPMSSRPTTTETETLEVP